MMEKYRSEVLRSYKQKKAEGELSSNLIHCTPVNIRNEVRMLFGSGCDPMDIRMLREFFELSLDKEFTDVSIKKCDPDKFKPLCNYLKKGVNTKEKNIELLAWLIDFRPRPFANYWRNTNGKSDLSLLTISQVGIVEEQSKQGINAAHYSSMPKREQYNRRNNQVSKANTWNQDDAEVIEHFEHSEHYQKEITLEYPSGVKLKVDATDLSLIAQLVRL